MPAGKTKDPLEWVPDLTGFRPVDEIIDTFATFVLAARFLVTHPETCVDDLDLAVNPRLAKAVKFVTASFAICYMIALPAFYKWSVETSKIVFIFDRLIEVSILAISLGVGLKILGSPATLKSMTSVFLFICGLCLPFYFIFILPTALATGTSVLGAGPPHANVHFTDTTVLQVARLLPGGFAVLIWTFGLFAMKPMLGISPLRFAGGILLGSTVAGLMFIFALNPLFELIDKASQPLIKYVL